MNRANVVPGAEATVPEQPDTLEDAVVHTFTHRVTDLVRGRKDRN